MKVKTANKINIHDKPKVLFVSHPSDFVRYFELLSSEILSSKDCAIYYYENGAEDLSEDWQRILLEINLIVIPITDRFLSEQNMAAEIYSYAQEKNIPVLPIMMEAGLDRKFNSVCGQKQFLDRTDEDPTSIPYPKKLGDFLSTVLIGDDLSKKVRAAFDAYVFLSYRKKDRKYAQHLMRTIHENEFARDVAIWYDEFLQPDENFNESIRNALLKSDLFALAVTPNLVDENNYVISDEYPAALEAEKKILPVELIDTDKKLLQDRFSGLPECVSINDSKALTEALLKSLSHVAKQPQSKEPEHNYYIGLAYLHGIDVEIDRDRAIELIVSAAENGVLDAAKDLVKIYYYGFSAYTNFSKAIYWQKKLVQLIQKEYDNSQSVSLAFDLADALRFLTEIERSSTTDNQNIDEMIENCKRALDICDNTNLSNNEVQSRFIECKINTLQSLAILYEHSENYGDALIAYYGALGLRELVIKADETLDDELVKIINKCQLAQLHHDIGIMYCKEGNYIAAISEMKNSIEIYHKVSEEFPNCMPHMAGVHRDLSSAATHVDLSLAEKHSTIAVEICEALVHKDKSLYELTYANALLNRASVLTELGWADFDEMERLCLTAEDIYERRIGSASYEISFNYIYTLYKLAGINRKKYTLDKARHYYEKATDIASDFLDVSLSESKLTIAHIFFDYGTFLTIEASRSDLIKAVECLKKALSLFEITGNEGHKYVDETNSLILAIECELDNNDDLFDDPTDISDDIKKAFFNFKTFLEKGDEAEESGNYRKACLNYKSALEQFSLLEKLNGEMDDLLKADVLDRLAYCCEMSQDLSGAEVYYVEAAELASSEARKTRETRAVRASMSYLQKVISFFEDYGRDEDASKYHRRLKELKDYLLGNGGSDDTSMEDDDEEQIVNLPDRDGNIIPFKLLGTVECKDRFFGLFMPTFMSAISLDALLIVQFEMSPDEELSFGGVAKPALAEKIYEQFRSDNIDRFSFAD